MTRFLHETELSVDDYISEKGWLKASPPACPRGRCRGDCGMVGNGSYGRLPAGMRVRRWYCRFCHESFSAMPVFLAAGMHGTLSEIEAVVIHALRKGISSSAREWLGNDGAGERRWVRRRLLRVTMCLTVLVGMIAVLADTRVDMGLMAARLGDPECLLVDLRRRCATLRHLPTPVGFDRRIRRSGSQTGPPAPDGTGARSRLSSQ